MFNRKRKLFLGLVAMSFILIFTSACKKAEVYDLDIDNNNKDLINNSFQSEDIIEDQNFEEVAEEIIIKEEIIVKKEKEIIFKDLEWKNYTNKLLKYNIEYPTIVNIIGNDLDQHLEFIGPLVNNEWWPKISISHYSNDFYRPGEGVELAEWVKPFPEYEAGEEISIIGLETIHYRQIKTPQAWASDYYYFIKDNQLYNITITHTNDKEDWHLYNKMLESFIFIDEEISEEVEE